MRQILTIARKELRGYFLSPVALIFIGVFLVAVLFSFFWGGAFFRRNLADVRPLFDWLPLTLTLLVAAITMRLWSEEQRSGTLEVLLTLPVKIHRLVLGKFIAGLGLILVALLLTVGLPITVSFLGDLDWGPVFGGYLAAILVAAAYLSIGLCISSATSNPLVALLLTFGAGICLYAVGSDTITSLAGNRLGEVLRDIGVASRFDSIERGVVDLRDLVYYGSITLGFLFLNVVLLEAKRWGHGRPTRRRRWSATAAAILVCCNLVLLNVVLSPLRGARVDMTERNEYSISEVTEEILSGLDAPLLIRGYFSAKTHPKLAPLVPRIRDTLEEYAAVGGDGVTAEVVDPLTSPALEKEANEAYGIKSVPFQFADRHEAAVVNSYFEVLVKYGDGYETLGFEDLVEINVTTSGGDPRIEARLRNLEYDLTRTIKKLAHGFKPLEDVFARSSKKVKLTAYVTPKSLPDNFKELPGRIEEAAKEIEKRSGGKFALEVVDPSGEDKRALRRELHDKYGFRPMAASLFASEAFYMHLLLRMGDSYERLLPAPETSKADLKREIEASLKRMVPGFLKTVGLHVPEQPPPMNPRMRRRRPRGPQYRTLQRKLEETYNVERVDLKSGRVPGNVDTLLLVRPENLDDKQRYAVDQFLMRGGAVIACVGRYSLEPVPGVGLAAKKIDSKLGDLLEAWGIEVEEELVLDPQNEKLSVPHERQVMGLRVQEIVDVNYPFWVDIRKDGMAEASPMLAGLPSITLQWPSPLELKDVKGVSHTVLLRSSSKAWTQTDTDIRPDFGAFPDKGFGPGKDAKLESQILAVAATGTFTSAFKGKASPLVKGAGARTDTKDKDSKRGKVDKSAGTIESSPDSARVVVIGSGDFVRDQVLFMSRRSGTDRYINNLRFLHNAVDWSVADEDLLSIRARGSYARTLEPLTSAARTTWEAINYVIAALGLGVIVIFTLVWRRSIRPLRATETTR